MEHTLQGGELRERGYTQPLGARPPEALPCNPAALPVASSHCVGNWYVVVVVGDSDGRGQGVTQSSEMLCGPVVSLIASTHGLLA